MKKFWKQLKRAVNLPGAFLILVVYSIAVMCALVRNPTTSKDKFMAAIPWASGAFWVVLCFLVVRWLNL